MVDVFTAGNKFRYFRGISSGVYHTCALLLGSNIGNRLENLLQAVFSLESETCVILKLSAIYETAAWGNTDQDPYYNCALTALTPFPPGILLQKILQIEKQMGRKREIKWGPRTIDIDILLYRNYRLESENLQVPHPQMHLRRFALLPLNEIAANMIHPIFRKSIAALLRECPDTLEVRKTDML